MTMTQTVKVPDDRRIMLDVPPQIAAGETARFEVIWFPVSKETKTSEKSNNSFPRDKNGKILLTKTVKEQLLADEALRSLTGILHTDMSLDEIREERLAKYSK
ncbi:MAG: hypothetical protein LBU66_07790 [Treponema sp.]|jgi:hypothetical protein|nr:hypothetical protein [Treponema sp.]